MNRNEGPEDWRAVWLVLSLACLTFVTFWWFVFNA